MREVSFIMPTPPGSTYEHRALQSALVIAFGGFSCDETSGAWTDDAGKVVRDSSIRYTIAHIWTPSLRHKLTNIVMATGQRLGQKCVYFVWDRGDVEILDV